MPLSSYRRLSRPQQQPNKLISRTSTQDVEQERTFGLMGAASSQGAEFTSTTSLPKLPNKVKNDFNLPLNAPKSEYEMFNVSSDLIGREIEYHDIHASIKRVDGMGKYSGFNGMLLASTKLIDSAGNNLLKIVGDGLHISEQHTCIELVTCPLTHEQWLDMKGVAGAVHVFNEAVVSLLREKKDSTFSLAKLISEYNKKIKAYRIHEDFELEAVCGDLVLSKSNNRKGLSTQTNVTFPFRLLIDKIELLNEMMSTPERKSKFELPVNIGRGLENEFKFLTDNYSAKGETSQLKTIFSFLVYLFIYEGVFNSWLNKPEGMSIPKFEFDWLPKTTYHDIIYSCLTQGESRILLDYLIKQQDTLVALFSYHKDSSFGGYFKTHLNQILFSLRNRIKIGMLTNLKEDEGNLVSVNHDSYIILEGGGFGVDSGVFSLGPRIAPLLVNHEPSIVIEGRRGDINKKITPHYIYKLRSMYKRT